MQATRRRHCLSSNPADNFAEVSSAHAICSCTPHSRGVQCHMLPVAHFTGCSQQRITENTPEEAEQQPERSLNLNFMISRLTISVLEEHTAWFGLSFNKCLLGMLSSVWQHSQQVNSSTGLMCSDTTLQAEGHLHSGPPHAPKSGYQSLQPPSTHSPHWPVSPSIPVFKDILCRDHSDAKLYFSITERYWLFGNKAQIT